MAKSLSTYRAFTASDINSRASDTCDHVVNGSVVDCTNVKASKVKNLLGEANHELETLCKSDLVNKYSGFSPYLLEYSDDGTLTSVLNFNKPTSNYSLGSFAGYNHSAQTVGWHTGAKAAIETAKAVNSGSTATFDAYIDIGELRYPSPAAGLCLTLWNGASLIGFGITALSGLKGDNCLVSAETSAISSNITVTSKVFIIDSTTEFAANGANVLCKVPNVDDASTSVVAIPASSFALDGVDPANVVGEGCDFQNGRVAWTSAQLSYSLTNLQVLATLTKYDNSETESIEMYNDAVSANTTFYPSTSPAQFVRTPIPDYGYTIKLVFNESA